MEPSNNELYEDEMNRLCSSVRDFIMKEDYAPCVDLICESMARYPHSPEPHNLLAIVLEKTGDHQSAMKHFQAAVALDPDYLPAKYNLRVYGTFFTRGNCAFTENDITMGSFGDVEIVYDNRNIAHAVNKKKIEYDEHGIGHVVRKPW